MMSVDSRRQRAQRALEESGYGATVEDELEEQKKRKRKKAEPADEIEWMPAIESVQTTGKN